MWTVDHEADIASDLSAFHRVDDPMQIDGPRYFSLALRLAAYAGVIAAIVEKKRQEEKNGPHGGYSAAPGTGSATPNPGTPSRVPDSVALGMIADDPRWAPEIVKAGEA